MRSSEVQGFYTEAKMVQSAYDRLSTLRVRGLSIEVPFSGRRIDLVFRDEEHYLIAVEFKLEKWKVAINQASLHVVAVDKSYICVPNAIEHLVDFAHAARWGVGVFTITESGWPFKEVLNARLQHPWERLKQRIMKEVPN